MTDLATIARANAYQVEARKHALRQQQDGCWILTLKVHSNDMPEDIMKAAMGQRYVCAMVAVGDDEKPIEKPRQEVVPASAGGDCKDIDDGRASRTRGRNDAPDDIPGFLDRRPKSPAQIAGYLCTTIPFQKFLHEKFRSTWQLCMSGVPNNSADYGAYAAAATVRELCHVDSRADIKPDNAEWSALLLAFRLWEKHPELEDVEPVA